MSGKNILPSKAIFLFVLLFYALSTRVELVLTFSFLCWFGGLNVKSKNALNKVVNVCGKILGERHEYLSQLYESHMVWKARVTVDDNSHVLAKCYEILRSVYDFPYRKI